MKLRALLIMAAAAGLAAGGAYAQTPPGPPPMSAAHHGPAPEMRAAMEATRKACEADMTSLCSGKKGPEAMMCMHDNHDKLSKPCQDAIADLRAQMRKRFEARREAMQAAKKVCEPDMASLCASKTGRDAMMCMHDHRDKVSQACKDAIAKARPPGRPDKDMKGMPGMPMGGPPSSERHAAMQAAKAACEPDMKALCVGKTGREAMMCMHENHDKVSQTCKDAMAKVHPMQGRKHDHDGVPPPAAP
ncbi:MAG TPA: hypothetical protein VG960_04695 [Caulobacteraceae bacterium]|nr:hypothetical protein [Caulobacteraceae bacterium]